MVREKTIVYSQKKMFDRFEHNESGELSGMMGSLIMAVVAIVIVAILVSALIPAAMTSIIGTNTTTWGAGAIAMWGALGIFIVLAVLLLFVAIILTVIKSADR